MENLWEIITGNSSLPVQLGNTLWDHLNNQQGGGPITLTIYEDLIVTLAEDDFIVELDEQNYEIELDESDFVVELDEPEFEVEIS